MNAAMRVKSQSQTPADPVLRAGYFVDFVFEIAQRSGSGAAAVVDFLDAATHF